MSDSFAYHDQPVIRLGTGATIMCSAGGVFIDSVSECSDADWNRIHALDPFAMPSQSTEWAAVICESDGYRAFPRHYRFSDGIEAVLPLFVKRATIRTLRVYRSLPLVWEHGGPISTAPLSSAHLREILADCATMPGAAIQFYPNPLMTDAWSQATAGLGWKAINRCSHVLDLRGGFDEIWNRKFSGETRRMIRRAERLGITVESGCDDSLIEQFDRLFRLSLKRWAHKQHEAEWMASFRGWLRDPPHKFHVMARHAGKRLRISLARKDGEAVAGVFVLFGQNAQGVRSAMNYEAVGNTGANMLLYKTVIQEACERSCQHFHMGESGASEALGSFKGRFGAEPFPNAEYHHERIPLLSGDRALRGFAKRAIGFQDA